MATVTLLTRTDADINAEVVSPFIFYAANALWTPVGTADKGTAAHFATDGLSVVDNSGGNIHAAYMANLGGIPTDSPIISVQINAYVRLFDNSPPAPTLASFRNRVLVWNGVNSVEFTYPFDQQAIGGASGTSQVTSATYVTYTKTLTNDPNTGLPWTQDVIYKTSFGLQGTFFTGLSADDTVAEVDQISLIVTYTPPSWWFLGFIPLLMIIDAMKCGGQAAFVAKWGPFVGSVYAAWIYTLFCAVQLKLPAAVPVSWYTFTPTAPGSLWTAAADPGPYGWFQSTDGFASASNLVIAGTPHNPRSFTEIVAFATGTAGMLGGFPGTGVQFRNHFIYASGGYTVNTTAPSLRIFDGLSDREIISIPKTAAGVVSKAIMSMVLVGEIIYLTTLDSGTTSADFAGRVFEFNPLTGSLTQVGADFTGGGIPYAICFHMNRLWVGTNKSSAAGGKVYFFRPGIDTTWTLDFTLSTLTAGSVCSLASYKGRLFVGGDDINAVFAQVLVRDSFGAYTSSLTATGGTAKKNNGFLSMIVFLDNLYATYWNPDTTAVAKIYKYNNTSWSTVYTGAAGLLRPYIGQFLSNSRLFTIGGGNTLSATLLSTVDGTTYIDRTSSQIGTSTSSPVFGEVII